MKTIDMHELRQLSAAAIQALPSAVAITDGTATVGMLVPVRSVSRDHLPSVMAEIEVAAATRSPEENAAIDALLAERGVD